MGNNVTELVFILDESGSMGGLVSDTIGGFNAMIEKQKQNEGECIVSTVSFSDNSKVIHNRIDLKLVPPMTRNDYNPCGSTALLDAIGNAVMHISMVQKNEAESKRPSHTMFVITTDGYENSSREFNYRLVKKLITEKEKEGWEFVFIGANIDSVEVADNLGIRRGNSINYKASGEGTARMYRAVSRAVDNMRSTNMVQDDWAEELKDDGN